MANNVFGGQPNSVVAKATIDFVSAGITVGNMEIIYLIGDPILSFIPGRPINGITGFVSGKGYYMIPKIDLDLTSCLTPPVDSGGGPDGDFLLINDSDSLDI